MKIIILGGYGNFGARIARALVGNPGIELVVAGRDAGRCAAMADQLGHGSRPWLVDVSDQDLSRQLRGVGAELVIHTAGPFQRQDYHIPLAVAAAGAHYIDLSDGRRFVCDFASATDAAFRVARRLGLSGASTVPALSGAVLDYLCKGWQQVHEIDLCIAPAQQATRGQATMAAVLSYCGAPIQVWQGGQWVTRYGWARPSAVQFARLPARVGALCDIADLELLPARYPGVRSVMFRAALEVGLTQRALALLALLRRLRLVPAPLQLASWLTRVAPLFDRFGTELGGMVVRASGLAADGQAVRRTWHIAADHNHGPEIPVMAAIVLARQLAAGALTHIGGQPCLGLLTLADFEPEFAKWGMVSDLVSEASAA